jgi:hypothetical protein
VSTEPGQPKVEEPGPRLRQHDVSGLQVAVDDALLVSRGQGIRDLPGHLEGLVKRQRSLLEAIGQGLANQVLHDEEGLSAFFADVVQRTDVGMSEHGDRLGFALEAGLQLRIGGEIT